MYCLLQGFYLFNPGFSKMVKGLVKFKMSHLLPLLQILRKESQLCELLAILSPSLSLLAEKSTVSLCSHCGMLSNFCPNVLRYIFFCSCFKLFLMYLPIMCCLLPVPTRLKSPLIYTYHEYILEHGAGHWTGWANCLWGSRVTAISRRYRRKDFSAPGSKRELQVTDQTQWKAKHNRPLYRCVWNTWTNCSSLKKRIAFIVIYTNVIR